MMDFDPMIHVIDVMKNMGFRGPQNAPLKCQKMTFLKEKKRSQNKKLLETMAFFGLISRLNN